MPKSKLRIVKSCDDCSDRYICQKFENMNYKEAIKPKICALKLNKSNIQNVNYTKTEKLLGCAR